MKKLLLIIAASSYALTCVADINTDHYNSPTVNSAAASSQQFPSQNHLTGNKGQRYNTSGPRRTNKPTVNSAAASSQQFPVQNQLTGNKGERYNTPDSRKLNSPTVNSAAASSQQFPEQNNFNNNGHGFKRKNTASNSGGM